ncbi:gas vesicle protein GvpN [Virgibacillus xinjiangensis]|uniref:Gas vesicle protein GvpN n=1 Tax=Virgibacillus xinjiangensis TaxID=393090 RepID=A0ABV7CVD1_9BACI
MADSKAIQQQNQLYEESTYYQGLIDRGLNYLDAGYPVHFTGSSGIGKTTLALHIAKQRKRPVMLIHGNQDLSNEDLIGTYSGYTRSKLKDNYVRSVYKIEENVSESWTDGRLLEAIRKGYTLVYDEFTRSRPETNNIFLPILEEKILPLYGTKQKGTYMKVHPEFSVIFTSNPGEYAGVFSTQDALLDRMVTLPMDSMDTEAEAMAIRSKTDLEQGEAEAIVRFMQKVRGLSSQKEDGNGPGLRACLMIADIASRQGIPIDGNNDDFVRLCLDITWFPLKNSVEEKNHSRVRKQLEQEARKVKVGEET